MARQVKKFLGENPEIPDDVQRLLEAISATYVHADEDRAMIDRSLDISTKELTQINQTIENQVHARTEELTKEHGRFVAAINSIKSGFILCDVNQTIIMINQSALSMLANIHEGQTVPNPSIVNFDSLLESKLKLSEAITKSTTSQEAIEYKDISYQNSILSFFIAPIMGQLGTVILIEDITDEKIRERSKEEFFPLLHMSFGLP